MDLAESTTVESATPEDTPPADPAGVTETDNAVMDYSGPRSGAYERNDSTNGAEESDHASERQNNCNGLAISWRNDDEAARADVPRQNLGHDSQQHQDAAARLESQGSFRRSSWNVHYHDHSHIRKRAGNPGSAHVSGGAELSLANPTSGPKPLLNPWIHRLPLTPPEPEDNTSQHRDDKPSKEKERRPEKHILPRLPRNGPRGMFGFRKYQAESLLFPEHTNRSLQPDEERLIDNDIAELSVLAETYGDYTFPKSLPRRPRSGDRDQFRLLRPICVDGISLSILYGCPRPPLVDENRERRRLVLSTKAMLIILYHYFGRGYKINIHLPREYVQEYKRTKLVDDEEVFAEILKAGLIIGCDEFEDLLKTVKNEDACLLTDLDFFLETRRALPRELRKQYGLRARRGVPSPDYLNLDGRFIQVSFKHYCQGLCCPNDKKFGFDYTWLKPLRAQESLFKVFDLKKLYRDQLTFQKQIENVKLCNRLLGSGRHRSTEARRFQMLMEENEKRREVDGALELYLARLDYV
ncbi:hypothetical protein L596_001854 [Steinernema carpocapsae]|uniref:Uncharacterized protein n=1 Tax=Steinernema carpocapsae TaxID=34508 RepID=A0A4U8UMC3_STECR|nr:hypothetical protein L596_001854 [Steinernema carpocapsae]